MFLNPDAREKMLLLTFPSNLRRSDFRSTRFRRLHYQCHKFLEFYVSGISGKPGHSQNTCYYNCKPLLVVSADFPP